ncbi:UDP-Glycosyltransferase/glycogen phosphorylase [Gigaspora margarita]|uniref:UDP-Glycosyltransferase/glycogen phosphorylase n=1 Tax=Gigaspora margarita TaxID=4874 RepID=A0A8H4AX89_GIGMA|nr:UDP-Glycosyltransferase/glycogen phosphorylase [Gigaspora margarita]
MYSKLWYLAIFIILFINTNLVTETNGAKKTEFIQRELDIDKSDTPKNILVGSILGGVSHLNPILEICKILVDRGYNVTLLAPGNFTATSTLYRSIPQIIIDNFACFDLAWKLKKPVVGYTSGTTYFTPPPPIRSDPIMGRGCHVSMENESFYNRFICAVVQPLRAIWTFQDSLNNINAIRAEVGVSKDHDFRGRTDTLFLLDNFFGFEVPTAWPPLHQEIGPILPDIFPNLSSDLDLFLSTHPRTMYIALGSCIFTTPENYATILQSALELIHQNILDGVIWATVKFNESELPTTFNLSNGNIIPTSNLINNLHPHIYIMKYAPQFAILSHENTKVFLSHGGVGSSHESMYTATPMLVLPIVFDQPGNAERLELTGMALKLSKFDLKVDDIISKVERLLNEESFKTNAKRMQVLAKFNSKRKYRGADLIEIMLNWAKYDGNKNENGELEVDIQTLLRSWITPDSRMGFIRGNYLDVFGAALIITLVLFISLGYGFYKVVLFAFRKWSLRSRESHQRLSKAKNE